MLTDGIIRKLRKCFDGLTDINDELFTYEVVNHFIEVIDNESDIVIRGNAEGLIYLATTILDLALARIDDKHYHFDETTVFDRCDKELVIAYKRSEGEFKE